MTETEAITKDAQIRKGIIASVIASVIVIILIQPLLRLAWSFLSGLGAQFIQNYIDSIYRSAALGHRNYLDVLMMGLLFSFVSGASVGIGISFTRRLLFPRREGKRPSKTRLLALLWLSIVLLHIWALLVIIKPYADLQHNTSFQQRLKVLAPKQTETEEEELEAMWASMRSRKHFEEIKARMEAIAQEHALELPPTLLK